MQGQQNTKLCQDIPSGTASEAGISRSGEGTAVLEQAEGFICTETLIKTRKRLLVSMNSVKNTEWAICKVQTLHDLHNSYIPQHPEKVRFCASRN